MRRISLALALVSAVAATGCGGGAGPATTGDGKGTAGVNFTVTVRNTGPGTVTSSPAGITCAPDSVKGYATCSGTFAAGQVVVLTATVSAGKYFNGWYGECSGTGTCTLDGNADKYVVSYFSDTAQAHENWAAGHPNRTNLRCTDCHGAQMTGQGLAPSCASCHVSPMGGHFLASAEPWGNHGTGWDQACQRCHTNEGFLDYIGADGSPNLNAVYPAPLQSDNPNKTLPAVATDSTKPQYATGTLLCATCHNDTAAALTTVTFPSGKQVTTDGATAICGQCHGARESTASIDAKIATATGGLDAQFPTAQGFINPHYLGAAATLFGGDAQGWAQYAGNTYTGTNAHGGQGSCVSCHNAHNGEIVVTADTCGKCHNDELTGMPVANFMQLEESRQFGFEGDIDGDGISESVKAEIDGLGAKLYAAIQAYAANVANTPIAYTDAYPYFMNATTGAAYKAMTPRLLRATFNYKWYKAEPGAWAHNPRYAIEAMYDSIADLNVALAPLGKQVANGKRAFNGHFGAAEDPSPYAAMIYHGGSNAVTGEVLPTMGFTSAACYQCHGGNVGFTTYIGSAPAAVAAIPAGGKITSMQCATCHTLTGADMKTIRNDVTTVYFPPQKASAAGTGEVAVAVADLPAGFAVCATCHSGRENGATIVAKIGAKLDTEWSLGVTNPHYLGAAGMMMGADAGVMYQYSGNTYSAKPAFWSLTANGPHGSPHSARCTSCHNPKGTAHTFEIDLATTVPTGTWGGAYPIAGMNPGDTNIAACSGCHAGPYALAPKATEFEEASAELYAAIRAYAVANLDAIKTATGNANATGVCYWDAGVGGGQYYALEVSGVCQNGVAPAASIPFTKANPKLLKAAYNYLWTQKEPGAWAHNEFYAMQVIYDSIVDLGGAPAFKVAAVVDPTTKVPVAGDPLNRGY